MPKLPEVVTKKVGPLPIWAYVVVGAGFVFILRKRGGGSSSAGGQGISIPMFQPGSLSSISDGGNAVGSPAHNEMGGMPTQPGGAAPWWAVAPPWWNMPSSGPVAPVGNSPGTNPGSATAGTAPRTLNGVPLSPVVPSSIPARFRGLFMDDPANPGQLIPRN